jgi:hypothetical protein
MRIRSVSYIGQAGRRTMMERPTAVEKVAPVSNMPDPHPSFNEYLYAMDKKSQQSGGAAAKPQGQDLKQMQERYTPSSAARTTGLR